MTRPGIRMAEYDSYYTGIPSRRDRGERKPLPLVDPDAMKDPSGYLAPPGLVAAVNVALELGMPLLLTGEPGCGKSRLADSLAWELGFGDGKPLRFVVKSDTESRDLFYRFDTVGRFHAAQHEAERPDAKRFLTYNALGKAILYAKGQRRIRAQELAIMTEDQLAQIPQEGQRTVVLIDEIDKAPREVPNDILTEIEDLSFTVPELLHETPICLEDDEQGNRPIVVITSNSERELPEPFLRRCIYYHVELPPFRHDLKGDEPRGNDGEIVTIERIVEGRLGARFSAQSPVLADALAFFRYLRLPERNLQRRPGLAELLNWLCYLASRRGGDGIRLAEHRDLRASIGTTLLKHRDDQLRAGDFIKNWQDATG